MSEILNGGFIALEAIPQNEQNNLLNRFETMGLQLSELFVRQRERGAKNADLYYISELSQTFESCSFRKDNFVCGGFHNSHARTR